MVAWWPVGFRVKMDLDVTADIQEGCQDGPCMSDGNRASWDSSAASWEGSLHLAVCGNGTAEPCAGDTATLRVAKSRDYPGGYDWGSTLSLQDMALVRHYI